MGRGILSTKNSFPFLAALKDNPRRPFPLHVNVFTANHYAVVHVVSEWKRVRLSVCLEMALAILTHSLGKPLYYKGIMNMGNESYLCFPKSVVLDSAGGTESYPSALKGLGILIEEKMPCWFILNTLDTSSLSMGPLCRVVTMLKAGNIPLAP